MPLPPLDPAEARLLIESDGTSWGTTVKVDGKFLVGVRKIEFTLDAATGLSCAVLTVEEVVANVLYRDAHVYIPPRPPLEEVTP